MACYLGMPVSQRTRKAQPSATLTPKATFTSTPTDTPTPTPEPIVVTTTTFDYTYDPRIGPPQPCSAGGSVLACAPEATLSSVRLQRRLPQLQPNNACSRGLIGSSVSSR